MSRFYCHTFVARSAISLLVVIAAFLLTSCSHESPPAKAPLPDIVSDHGWPGGWAIDGTQLMIADEQSAPQVLSVSNPSSPVLAQPWDMSKARGAYARRSPDGKFILYVLYNSLQNKAPIAELYLLSQAGINSALIISATSMSYPAWSPDSKYFSVIYREGDTKSLRIYSANDLQYHDLFKGSLSLTEPAWSPDGTMIAVRLEGQFEFINVDSGLPTDQNTHSFRGVEPTWSPDGKRLAFIQPQDGAYGEWGNLIVAEINIGGSRMLAGTDREPQLGDYLYATPQWSPRGDYIAVRRVPAGVHDIETQTKKAEVVLIPVPADLK